MFLICQYPSHYTSYQTPCHWSSLDHHIISHEKVLKRRDDIKNHGKMGFIGQHSLFSVIVDLIQKDSFSQITLFHLNLQRRLRERSGVWSVRNKHFSHNKILIFLQIKFGFHLKYESCGSKMQASSGNCCTYGEAKSQIHNIFRS